MLNIDSSICIRFGKAIYTNAVSLMGKIVSFKTLKRGNALGYDGQFVASEDTLIGICNIGYVNGLERSSSSDAYVYIKGRKYKIVGNKCMDQCFILVDGTIKINDNVEFLGKNIGLAEFSKMNHRNSYEMLLNIR